jgi:hypothetical protein
MIHLPPGKWTTGALMRVVVPLALELVFFRGVWHIVLVPPMTMGVLAINLGLFFVMVRPRSWEPRIIGMLLAGSVAVFVTAGDYLIGDPMRSGPPGLLGRVLQLFLMNCAESLADPAGELASVLYLAGRHLIEIEGVLLDLLGLAVIGAGGRLENRCRLRWARARAVPPTRPIPADPGAATASRSILE